VLGDLNFVSRGHVVQQAKHVLLGIRSSHHPSHMVIVAVIIRGVSAAMTVRLG